MWNRPRKTSSPPRSQPRRRLATYPLGLSAALATWATLAGSSAQAGPLPSCETPDTVYVALDESAVPLLREAAWKLSRSGSPLNIVYKTLPGCAAVRTAVPAASCTDITCLKGEGQAVLQDIGVIPPKDVIKIHGPDYVKTCGLPATGVPAHLALAEVSATSCPAFAGSSPGGVVDQSLAVAPLALVTGRDSTEQSIQAAEAYFIYGKGKDANVRPWLDETLLIRRSPLSSLAVLFSLRTGLDPVRLRGELPTSCPIGVVCVNESDVVVNRLGKTPAGLAFMSTGEAESRLNELKLLAVQALGQRGAYYPNRQAGTVDKRNVRDGHYPLWGHLHVVAKADGADPKRPLALLRPLIDLLQGTAAAVDGEDPLLPQVRNGYVPQCAMAVNRSDDRAPLLPYTPAEPCGCWFEATATKSTNNLPAGCAVCAKDMPCGAGTCRRGFCEAR